MAKIITFGIQKGGSGKTTSSGIVAHLLSQKQRVLAVDLDSQGNLTELLTGQDPNEYQTRTVLEAMIELDATKYIHPITDNLHLIAAEDLLATFPRYLYTEFRGQNKALVLRDTLAPLVDNYDYIIIDTPPALGDQTINALAASDSVVVMFETSKFCYSALSRFLETVVHVQERVNSKLQVAGILRTMIDSRRLDAKALVELVAEEYEDAVFKTIINRKAATGRLSIQGFNDNPEIQTAVDQYKRFLKEMLQRV